MTRRAVIYRSLHGAPMLAGVPVHYALVLLALAAVLGFGALAVSTVGGVAVIAAALAFWAAAAFVFRQDRVAIPLLLLRLRFRLPNAITSYTASTWRLKLEDAGEAS